MKNFDETTLIDIENINIHKNKNEALQDKVNDQAKELSQTNEIDKNRTVSEKKESIKEDNALHDIVKNDFQEKTIVEMKTTDFGKIGIASDHRGYKMKQKLTKYLYKKGYTVVDYGGDGLKNDDYTEFGFKLGKAISNHEVLKGVAICGSGIGISIACNKVAKVRCAKVVNTKEAKWARRDNDANVIAISSSMPFFRVKDIIDVFLKEEFTGLERHQKRIDDLNNYKE